MPASSVIRRIARSHKMVAQLRADGNPADVLVGPIVVVIGDAEFRAAL